MTDPDSLTGGAPIDNGSGSTRASAPARAGRPRGSGTVSRLHGDQALEVQTIKTYRLGDDERRTVGHLRLILNQRYLPDHARVSVDGERLTLEWSEVSSR